MSWTEALARECAEAKAEVSVLLADLRGDILFSYEPRRAMVSASVIKTPIMLAALERVRRGEASLSQPLEVRAECILEDSMAFEEGPRSCSLEELLSWMIIRSDNTSTNVLIRWLGMEAVNAYCETIGLRETSLQREMLDFGAIAEGRNNYTSAEDMRRAYTAIAEKSILNDALCEKAMEILLRQRDSKKIKRYLWQDASVAHKTGGLDYLSHDAGILTCGGRSAYFGVFVQKAPDIDGDPRFIGRVGRHLFHYLTKGDVE